MRIQVLESDGVDVVLGTVQSWLGWDPGGCEMALVDGNKGRCSDKRQYGIGESSKRQRRRRESSRKGWIKVR